MRESDYSKEDLLRVLNTVGLRKGDLVFSHSNIAFWGRLAGCHTPTETARTILESILQTVGEEGGLIVPTFTYSHPNGKVYDPKQTRSSCGFFAEYVRQQTFACRSLDPNVSVAAIGTRAIALLENLPENAYEEESVWGKLLANQAVICNFNFDAASTFIHYVERVLRVPYRFDKVFNGRICVEGIFKDVRSALWVRHLQWETEPDFSRFHHEALREGLYKMSPLGRGVVGRISMRDTFSLVEKNILRNPNFLIKGSFIK